MAKTETFPDKPTWLAARRSGITSSDAPVIVGASPYKSPFQLYAEKLGLVEDQQESEAMLWGSILEPVLATRYGEETKRSLKDYGRFTLQRSESGAPWMLATLDREITGPRACGVLELKTTGVWARDDWQEEAPLHVQIQVQHQMAVMNWDWASIAVLIGGQRFLWLDVERNPRFIALLVEREAEFFARLEKLDPPPADASSRDALAKMFPRDDGTRVNLPPEALAWDSKLVDAKEQLKKWESVRDEADALLRGSIGEASIGVLPDGAGSYSCKLVTQERKPVEAKTVSFRVLRRLKA